jgi:hypothetical protein
MRAMLVFVVLFLLAAPACDHSPTEPTLDDMTGTWSGTTTYPNSPFTLVLTQTGTTVRGDYQDQLDRSLSVVGTYTAPDFSIVVDFGDAKVNLNGTVTSAHDAEGNMFTSALGNKMFPFTMTR